MTTSYPDILNEYGKLPPVERALVADYGVRWFMSESENKAENSRDFQDRLVSLFRIDGGFYGYINAEKKLCTFSENLQTLRSWHDST